MLFFGIFPHRASACARHPVKVLADERGWLLAFPADDARMSPLIALFQFEEHLQLAEKSGEI
jgi:hypothetical protein